MAFTNLTMNLTSLQSIEPLNISISGSNVLTYIIAQSNSYTKNYILMAVMIILFIIQYLTFSDKMLLTGFEYDDMRAVNLSLASSLLIGLTMLSVGWSPSFNFIGIFTILWVFSFIIIIISDNKE